MTATPTSCANHHLRRMKAQRQQTPTQPRVCKQEVLWLCGLSGGEEQKVVDLP
jgi:hypothetical protein